MRRLVWLVSLVCVSAINASAEAVVTRSFPRDAERPELRVDGLRLVTRDTMGRYIVPLDDLLPMASIQRLNFKAFSRLPDRQFMLLEIDGVSTAPATAAMSTEERWIVWLCLDHNFKRLAAQTFPIESPTLHVAPYGIINGYEGRVLTAHHVVQSQQAIVRMALHADMLENGLQITSASLENCPPILPRPLANDPALLHDWTAYLEAECDFVNLLRGESACAANLRLSSQIAELSSQEPEVAALAADQELTKMYRQLVLIVPERARCWIYVSQLRWLRWRQNIATTLDSPTTSTAVRNPEATPTYIRATLLRAQQLREYVDYVHQAAPDTKRGGRVGFSR